MSSRLAAASFISVPLGQLRGGDEGATGSIRLHGPNPGGLHV